MVGVHKDKHAEVGIGVLVEGIQGGMVEDSQGVLEEGSQGMMVDGMLVDTMDNNEFCKEVLS